MNQVKITFYIGLKTTEGDKLKADTVVREHVVPRFANFGVDGFTSVKGRGYWKGQPEPALIVSTIVEEFPDGLAESRYHIAKAFARDLQQECVLVTREPIDADFVRA